MRDADFVRLQIGHHLALGAPAREGDGFRIASRLIKMRRVSRVWRHEVRRSDGEIVALDDSRGAFLDLQGRIRPAPAGMLSALLAGLAAGVPRGASRRCAGGEPMAPEHSPPLLTREPASLPTGDIDDEIGTMTGALTGG